MPIISILSSHNLVDKTFVINYEDNNFNYRKTMLNFQVEATHSLFIVGEKLVIGWEERRGLLFDPNVAIILDR